MKLTPYRKAIVAGILAAIILAAEYYDAPWLRIAAAAAMPLSVYFARNEP